MSAKDRYRDCVKNALIKDGWVITHDPLRLPWGKKDMYVDLGAETLLAAEKDQRRIAVEIKSFVGKSEARGSGEGAWPVRLVPVGVGSERAGSDALPGCAGRRPARRLRRAAGTIDRERLLAPNHRIRAPR